TRQVSQNHQDNILLSDRKTADRSEDLAQHFLFPFKITAWTPSRASRSLPLGCTLSGSHAEGVWGTRQKPLTGMASTSKVVYLVCGLSPNLWCTGGANLVQMPSKTASVLLGTGKAGKMLSA